MKTFLTAAIGALMLLTALLACQGGGGDNGGGGNGGGNVSAAHYTVGGAVSGATGTVVLQNNGADDLSVAAGGAFTFATVLADGQNYNVTVKTAPVGQTCTASGNTGIIAAANVTNVSVVCSTNAYSVGGAVAGLSGTVVLQNNGGNDLSVSANGVFVFSGPLASGAGYLVTIKTQPAGQTCSASNNTGTVAGADVTNVSVACSVHSYPVGGTASGLNGTMVLTNNGADDLVVHSSGTFTFPTNVAYHAGYAVSIKSKPSNQNCLVTNGTGIMVDTVVSGVSVACSDKSWDGPANLADTVSLPGLHADGPDVAMDKNGNAVIVWIQSSLADYRLYKAEYRGNNWSKPTSTTDAVAQGNNLPHVAMDDNGNAIIAWQGNGYFYKGEYRNGFWTGPTSTMDSICIPADYPSRDPVIAMGNNGSALIGLNPYRQSLDRYYIFRGEYRNGVWSSPTATAQAVSVDGGAPAVAMDNSGNAIMTWYRSDGAHYQIYKSELRGGVWTDPTGTADHVSIPGYVASFSDVAMDNQGNAIIVWYQYDATFSHIYKAEYRGGVWTTPASIADHINVAGAGASASTPRVAMDDNGNAVIAWYQLDGTNWQIYKSEYRNGTWTHPASLADHISIAGSNTSSPMLAMDSNGNAVIVWSQTIGGTYQQVYKSEYRNGAWTHPASLADNISFSGTDAYLSRVAMGDNGDAIIVWKQHDGSIYNIYKTEYR